MELVRQLHRERRAPTLGVGGFDRIRQAALDTRFNHQPVDDDVQFWPPRERRRVHIVERRGAPVHQQAPEAFLPERLERGGHRGRLPVAVAARDAPGAGRVAVGRLVRHQVEPLQGGRDVGDFLLGFRRLGPAGRYRHDGHMEAQQDAGAGRQRREPSRHHLGRFAHHLLAAPAAEGVPDTGEEQAQVVVDLGRRRDRRPRVPDAVLLADGDRRRHPVDGVHVRLLHPLQELPGVGRQRLDIAALALGVDRVEGERRLARPAHARDDGQPAGGQFEADVLQVMRAGSADDDAGRLGPDLVAHLYCGPTARQAEAPPNIQS